ncbi:hypothetical protein J4480_03850 [Candidatus Woesearchaeota archaeon]|nr:hypothetical protein [Candidatus Woesearchaeota archaeon]
MVDDLTQTFLEEYGGAKDELNKGRYKNSAILFSKALFAICDILIQDKLNTLPKNHSERFRILEQYFKEIYEIVDDIFDKYTDSYSKPILKETCEAVKNGIKKINEITELPAEIKKVIK